MKTVKVTRGADRADQLLRDPDEYFRTVHAEARKIAESTNRPRVTTWADAGFSVAGLALGVAAGIVGALVADDDPAIRQAFIAVALTVPAVLSVAGIALSVDHLRRGKG